MRKERGGGLKVINDRLQANATMVEMLGINTTLSRSHANMGMGHGSCLIKATADINTHTYIYHLELGKIMIKNVPKESIPGISERRHFLL